MPKNSAARPTSSTWIAAITLSAPKIVRMTTTARGAERRRNAPGRQRDGHDDDEHGVRRRRVDDTGRRAGRARARPRRGSAPSASASTATSPTPARDRERGRQRRAVEHERERAAQPAGWRGRRARRARDRRGRARAEPERRRGHASGPSAQCDPSPSTGRQSTGCRARGPARHARGSRRRRAAAARGAPRRARRRSPARSGSAAARAAARRPPPPASPAEVHDRELHLHVPVARIAGATARRKARPRAGDVAVAERERALDHVRPGRSAGSACGPARAAGARRRDPRPTPAPRARSPARPAPGSAYDAAASAAAA